MNKKVNTYVAIAILVFVAVIVGVGLLLFFGMKNEGIGNSSAENISASEETTIEKEAQAKEVSIVPDPRLTAIYDEATKLFLEKDDNLAAAQEAYLAGDFEATRQHALWAVEKIEAAKAKFQQLKGWGPYADDVGHTNALRDIDHKLTVTQSIKSAAEAKDVTAIRLAFEALNDVQDREERKKITREDIESYNEICDYVEQGKLSVEQFDKYSRVENRSVPNKYGETVGDQFLKDDQFVYSYCQKIDADPKTFTVLNYSFAKDKNNVYIINGWGPQSLVTGMSDVVDASSFEVFGNTAFSKDQNNAYYFSDGDLRGVIEGAEGNSFVVLGKYYAKDINSVYTYTNREKTVRISEADTVTFEVLEATDSNDDPSGYSDNRYAKDKNRVYFHGEALQDLDVQSFSVLNGRYAKDADTCYLFGKITAMSECVW